MRAHLSTTTFDLDGAVTLDLLPETDWGDVGRRMNRVATLDGGAAFNDFGYSAADRTFVLRWTPVADVDDQVGRLLRLYSRVRLACHLGCFLVAVQSLKVEHGRSALTLLVVEQLA